MADGEQQQDLTDYLQPIANRAETIFNELLRLRTGEAVDRASAPALAMFFEEVSSGTPVFYGLVRIAAFPGREAVQMRAHLQRWRELSDPFMRLFEELRRRSPLVIDNKRYDLSLIDIEQDYLSGGVDVHVAAQHGDAKASGHVHTDLERLCRNDFADTAIYEIERIVRGKLPPKRIENL